ncbi:hypothetical protein FRC09_012272 [Ceratobasidium sp. 395]|nr:hypothetical protein FRC09_012272 [Ceratobasidium sp. 395]
MRFTAAAFALTFSLHALAAPVERASTVTPINAAAISSYSPYANFVAAAYCSGTANWSCTACKKVPGFVPYATGGDGNAVPLWYVGWWPAGSSVVVVHEGTDPTKFLSVLTDANAFFGTLSPALFPGVPSSVQVHSGFRDAHASTAATILTTVKKIIAERGATKVTVDFSRVTNEYDEIPIVPGRFLGYHHSSGEKHIKAPGVWNACAGQDNTSTDCSTGAVPDIIIGNLIDHLGPYEGVWVGTIFC